jgi:hypothetical protein
MYGLRNEVYLQNLFTDEHITLRDKSNGHN